MILVTGGDGLVGRTLYNIVSKYNIKYKFCFINRKICDLRNTRKVRKLFSIIKPDIVIHLAAKVGGLYYNMTNNYNILKENNEINMNIIECCRKFKVKKLINISSTCIFPDKNIVYPLTIDQLHNGLPHYSNIGYSYSKRLLHIMSDIMSRESQTRILNLIPTNLYGLYDNYNIRNGHVIPALIHKMYIAKKTKTKMYVKGDGKAERQFLYAKDFARIILYFVNNDDNGNTECIITGDKETSIRQTVEYMKDIFEYDGEIVYDKTYENGQMKKTVEQTNNTETSKLFEYTKLQNGLKKTIEYFQRNYDNLRY